jgi:carbon storage regulator
MLVLSRKLDEAIIIGDGIKVVVVQLKGGNVRLGIEAPPAVRVDREEVRESKDRFMRREGGAA